MFMVHRRNFTLLTTVNYWNIAPSLFGTIKNITPFLYGTYILLDTHTYMCRETENTHGEHTDTWITWFSGILIKTGKKRKRQM